jgi:hypothetical protein
VWAPVVSEFTFFDTRRKYRSDWSSVFPIRLQAEERRNETRLHAAAVLFSCRLSGQRAGSPLRAKAKAAQQRQGRAGRLLLTLPALSLSPYLNFSQPASLSPLHDACGTQPSVTGVGAGSEMAGRQKPPPFSVGTGAGSLALPRSASSSPPPSPKQRQRQPGHDGSLLLPRRRPRHGGLIRPEQRRQCRCAFLPRRRRRCRRPGRASPVGCSGGFC